MSQGGYKVKWADARLHLGQCLQRGSTPQRLLLRCFFLLIENSEQLKEMLVY